MAAYDKKIISYIDSVIERYVPEKAFPESMHDAMRYSLFGDGKRVRPYMMIAVCDMLGGDRTFIEPLFSALEMIHTYSLIHDDLPCMDDDELRRGKPTSHMVFGYAGAMLAGDGLLNLAYETLFAGYVSVKDKENYIKACSLLASCAGWGGMVGGQVADMMYDEKNSEPESLEYIYRCKTGALIRAAVMAGAYSAGIGEEALAKMERYAYLIGMLFQQTDDILDMKDGLPEEGKMTYLSVYGLDYVKKLCDELYTEAEEILAGFGNNADLKEFTQMIYTRNK